MSETKSKLLIFIVAYNAETTIGSVLRRIPVTLRSDYDVEVLIIDDASQDSTFDKGTTNLTTGARLAVNGKVLCTELEVQLVTDWPDYVFEPDYKLPALKDVEQQIERDHHLPGIASAAEVRREGIKVGQTQTKLLEKVEELTLYVIKLDKQLDQVNRENAQLRERVSTLEASGR